MVAPTVLDASAVVDFIRDAAESRAVLDLVADESCDIFVPHLCDLEVLSALRTRVRRSEVEPQHAKEALDLYEAMPLKRVGHLPLLDRAFALRDNFSAYDAAYVALAEAIGARLVTADMRLAAAVRRFTEIEVVDA
jgi:predicted nucleic acid-binding protein